jgi:phage gp36-like protein
MAYATAADISAEFKNITFDANSAVTDTEVTAFIAQEEAGINAVISNRYETPITGANSLLVMANISIAYVAFRVAKILNLKKDVPIPEKFIPQILNEGAKYKEAKQQLMDIQSGKIILSDAVDRSSTQGVKSYNAENSIAPLWERDTNQW